MSAPSHPAIVALPPQTREALHNESLPNDAWRGLKDKVDWSRVGSAMRLSRPPSEVVYWIRVKRRIGADTSNRRERADETGVTDFLAV